MDVLVELVEAAVVAVVGVVVVGTDEVSRLEYLLLQRQWVLLQILMQFGPFKFLARLFLLAFLFLCSKRGAILMG